MLFLARTQLVTTSLPKFTKVFYSGLNSAKYKAVEAENGKYFKNFLESYGYYDVFLIAANGDVVYSVTKEADLGTNLINGKYKTSGLAKAFRAALQNRYELTDIERYEPSNGAPAMFSAYPVKVNGRIVGALAFQIPLGKISNLMLESTGLGETGESYLVGEDYYFRSHTRLNKKAGKKDVTLKAKAESVTVKKALNNKQGHEIIVDYRGEDVISAYDYINFNNFKWAILAEIDVNEAIAPAFRLLYIIMITSLVIFIVVSIIAVMVARMFVKPIIAAVTFAGKISEKDLTSEIDDKYMNKKDEVGDLAKALKAMQGNLVQIVSEMNDMASNLAASAEEISSSSQSLAEGAQSQSASVEETSASIEELGASIVQVAENSENVNSKSQELLETAQNNSVLVENAVSSMDKITTSSERIAEILAVINDIADQTNLLALNAAIEAARAGEHGRGFAVVADEISKLAEKSTENAKEIEKLIKQSIKDVSDGTDIVKKAGDAFTIIIQSVNDNGKLLDEITKAIAQQKSGADQVQKAVEEINDVTQGTSASAEEMAASTEELQSQAEKVALMIDEFKLTENGNGKKPALEYHSQTVYGHEQNKKASNEKLVTVYQEKKNENKNTGKNMKVNNNENKEKKEE